MVRKAITEGNLKTEITSIDPYPRASIDAMSDVVIRKPLEDVENYDFITNLEAGDIRTNNFHICNLVIKPLPFHEIISFGQHWLTMCLSTNVFRNECGTYGTQHSFCACICLHTCFIFDRIRFFLFFGLVLQLIHIL